jgi:hypothetical protein
MNMRRAAITAIAATAAVATSALIAGVPAGAQEGELPLSVSPTSGSAGTLVTISGAGCVTEAGPGDVEVYLFNEGEEEPAVVIDGIVPDAEGNWQTQGPVLPTDPIGIHPISATCFESPESDVVVADYEFVDFEVTAPPTTTPPTTAPPSQPPVEEPEAAPATPVPAHPTFTG